MNPAWSVIFFTTLAGMAQGLVVSWALLAMLGATIAPGLQRTALGLALAMLLAGLVSSTFHLGRPARAWRSVLMWRTSWLSREVIVLPAFIVVVAHAWWWTPDLGVWVWPLLVAMAFALWLCTAMIYACLRFVQEWAHPYTLGSYVLIGMASGAVLAGSLVSVAGDIGNTRALAPWALGMTLAAGLVRVAALMRNAALKPKSSAQSATGIRAAALRQMAMGMTGGAFNTREFFHHAPLWLLPRLRLIAVLLLFVLPALLLLWAYTSRSVAAWPWLAALACMAPGLLAERWLFFAQARHPQNLYYQRVG